VKQGSELRLVLRLMLGMAAAWAVGGCEDGDTGPRANLESDGGGPPLAPDSDGGAAPTVPAEGAVAPAADALYLVPGVVEQGESGQTYLNLAKRLDPTTAIDPKSGREVQGWNYPVAYAGSVFIADSTAPTLTKYSATPDGQLQAVQTLSFAGVGFTEAPRSDLLYFVSPEKAYLFDATGLRAVVWNPTTMTLTGKEFTFPMVARPGLKASVRSDPYQAMARGSDLFLPVGWYDQDWKDRFVQALLIVDTNKDEVRGFIEDERCGDGFSAMKSATDDIYVFPSAGGGLQFHVNAMPPRPSCVLRVRAGEYTFDASYKLDLSALVGNVAAQGGIPDPKRTGFLFASYDPTLAVGDAKNLWRVHFYDFATSSVQPVQGDSAPWSGAMRYYEFEGRVLSARWLWNKSFEATTVVELPGGPVVNKLFSFAAAGTTLTKIR
jgi:hypothetical protein